jgi:hypothetical protein
VTAIETCRGLIAIRLIATWQNQPTGSEANQGRDDWAEDDIRAQETGKHFNPVDP